MLSGLSRLLPCGPAALAPDCCSFLRELIYIKSAGGVARPSICVSAVPLQQQLLLLRGQTLSLPVVRRFCVSSVAPLV